MNLSEKIVEIMNQEFPGGADDLLREFSKVLLKNNTWDPELKFVVLLIQAQIVSISSQIALISNRIEKIEQAIDLTMGDGK